MVVLPEFLKSILRGNESSTTHLPREIMDQENFKLLFKADLEIGTNRLDTFLNNGWNNVISIHNLAYAGFCYTGKATEVVCYDCKGKISNWKKCDDPLTLHKKMYPQCNFAKSKLRKKGNVVAFDSRQPTVEEENERLDRVDVDTEENGMHFFMSEYNRLMSFKDWPLSSPVDRYDLAAAGFYCKDNTSVVCVGCFLEVSNWVLGDRPQEKHKLLEKTCQFADMQSKESDINIVEIRQFIKSEKNVK